MEHIDAAHTRKESKKAARKAQEEAAAQTKSSRLQFTEEELSTPELEKYIEKSNRAADRLDAAKAAIPKQKKLVKEHTFDEATGKAKTRLRFEEREKPMPGSRNHKNPLSRPAQEAGIFVHNTVHSVEKDNSGVEGAHKSERTGRKRREIRGAESQTGLPQPQAQTLPESGKGRESGGKGECQLPVPQDAPRQPAAYKQSPFPLLAETADKKAVCKGSKGRRRKGYQSRSGEHPESGQPKPPRKQGRP